MFFRCALQQSGTRVRVIARRQSQPSQHWRSSNMCFSSRHGIIDVDFLHDRCLEFARVDAVNHCFVDQLVAKLSEVLKYHLCQKFDRLAEKAKSSEDIRMQELEECEAFMWLFSAEDPAALGGLVKGCLKVLSSVGPSSSHRTTPQQKMQTQTHAKPVNVMRHFFAVGS